LEDTDGEFEGAGVSKKRLESAMHTITSSQMVTLNLRGKTFRVHRCVLLEDKATFFYKLLTEKDDKSNGHDEYFIDRSHEGFDRILHYLSTGRISYKCLSMQDVEVLESNLLYFNIQVSLRWVAGSLPSNYAVKDNGRLVVTTDSSLRSKVLRATNPSSEFKCRIVTMGNADQSVYIGFVTETPCELPTLNVVQINDGHEYRYITGWYIDARTCQLYVRYARSNTLIASQYSFQAMPLQDSIGLKSLEINCTIVVKYIRAKGELHFEVDGQDVGSCFRDLAATSLLPSASPGVQLL
jgi:hypothetical protein